FYCIYCVLLLYYSFPTRRTSDLDVAIYNSIPTAEGTIMMAMEHTDYTLHSSRICVTGFGRVGHTVANKFSALGAKVSVSAESIRSEEHTSELQSRFDLVCRLLLE